MAFINDEEKSERVVIFGGITNLNSNMDSCLSNQLFVIEVL